MLFSDKALTERAEWIANRVGLGAVMDRHPPTLPFADLRRLELAAPIARDPAAALRTNRLLDDARRSRGVLGTDPQFPR